MSERGDELVETGAERLDDLADEAATSGGLKAKVADELAEDAAFLRKLKPSLVAARIRGEQPQEAAPGSGPRRAPSATQIGPRSSGGTSRGPSPLAVVAAAAAAGILLAKIVDWRGHAHPRL